jgi:serralysin
VLVGGAGTDRLAGGAGSNVLIGGTGSDKLTGGIGGDLLIGGATSFDLDPAGLSDLLAEWSSANDYATRVGHLTGTPGGANGGTFLTAGVTVLDDGLKDVLAGGTGTDLFVAGGPDALDLKAGEQKLVV